MASTACTASPSPIITDYVTALIAVRAHHAPRGHSLAAQRGVLRAANFDLFGLREIADYLGVSEATARRYRDAGMPVCRPRGKHVYSRSGELDAWMAAHRPGYVRPWTTDAGEPTPSGRPRWRDVPDALRAMLVYGIDGLPMPSTCRAKHAADLTDDGEGGRGARSDITVRSLISESPRAWSTTTGRITPTGRAPIRQRRDSAAILLLDDLIAVRRAFEAAFPADTIAGQGCLARLTTRLPPDRIAEELTAHHGITITAKDVLAAARHGRREIGSYLRSRKVIGLSE